VKNSNSDLVTEWTNTRSHGQTRKRHAYQLYGGDIKLNKLRLRTINYMPTCILIFWIEHTSLFYDHTVDHLHQICVSDWHEILTGICDQQRRPRGWSHMVVKRKMADGRHLKIVIWPYLSQKNHISMTFCKQQQQSKSLDSIQRRACQIILSDRTYNDACSVLGLPSIHVRRQELSQKLLHQLTRNNNCLHYLIPDMRDPSITDRLRSANKFPCYFCKD